ncbi:hypothetical protein AAIM60_18785 [Pseudomonas lijiangensis]|uniref:hypothetical protein n=1 Tax=Pseudomonas lijiangensis TaxID=2995658 RepID=UPI0031BAC939
MSINLNLVIYQREGDDLVEEDLRTARCEEISPSLLDAITEKFLLQEGRVYFDRTKEDFFEIEYFARPDIPKIINMLENLFRDLIRHEYALLNIGSDKQAGQLKDSTLIISNIFPGQAELDPTLMTIGRFRILISIIDIFTEMQTKFLDEPGAFLKLG